MNNLVNVPTNGTNNVETYLLLEELDEVEGTYNNLIDIDNANVNCSNNDPSNCPSDALLSDILIDLQQVTLLNSSMLVGTFYDEIMKGIFNCIAERYTATTNYFTSYINEYSTFWSYTSRHN